MKAVRVLERATLHMIFIEGHLEGEGDLYHKTTELKNVINSLENNK